MENKKDFIIVRTDGNIDRICEEGLSKGEAKDALKKHKALVSSDWKLGIYERSVTYTPVTVKHE